jgi:hypothetical protein
MGVFEEDKPSGGLPKELLDIGIRSAFKAGKPQEAVKLARTGRGTVSSIPDDGRLELMSSGRPSGQVRLVLLMMLFWPRANIPVRNQLQQGGGADCAESLAPLIMCMSISGPQYPLLTRLSKALANHPKPNSDSSQITLLRTKIDNLIQTRERSATRPLSSNDKTGTVWTSPTPDIDSQVLCEEIGCEELEVGVVVEMVRRLDKASRTAEEAGSGERGVRQL